MKKLILNNSYCKIVGFPDNILNEVKSTLSYIDQDVKAEKGFLFKKLKYFKNNNDHRKIYGIKAALKKLGDEKVCHLTGNQFPTGLLPKVLGVLKAHNALDFKTEDKREKPTPELTLRWNVKPSPLRYYQEEIIDQCDKYERGVIWSCVGSGKTRCMVELIKQKEVPTLIITPSKALIEQTYDVMAEAFGDGKVEMLDSATVKRKRKFSPIRIINIDSVRSLIKSGSIDKLSDGIGMLLIDEVHHSGAKSYLDMLSHLEHVYYRYGFSGSFIRNDSKTMDMHGVLSNVLYYYPPKKALEDKFLTPVEYNIHQLPGTAKRNYVTEYRENYCGGVALMQRILKIVEESQGQILILIDRKEASGQLIHEYLKEKKFDNSYISGDNSKEEIAEAITKFNSKEIKILIGSTVIGEGINIKSTQHLILGGGGKSPVKFTQAIGRAVRLDEGKDIATVHDFLFESTYYLEKHLFMRLENFKNDFAGEVKWV